MLELMPLVLGGLLAGTLGGLLGIGGGIVLMPLLRFVVGLSPSRAVGTCIIAVFCTTLGGSYRHYRLGHVNLRSILPVILSGAAATGAFSMIFVRLARQEHWLDLGIGVIFSLISARMIAEGIPGLLKARARETNGNGVRGSLLQKVTIGAAAGVLPGMLGIGTGGVLVPAFAIMLRAPIKTAVAASLTCFCSNALISSAFKLAQGFIHLDTALPICLGTFVGANLGALLNRRASSGVVKLIFGLVFTYVSLKFILSFFGVKI